MEKEWWKKSTVYQIYPKSFLDTTGDGSGDIRGIIRKLDYLSGLGVDVLWLSPIYDSPQEDNGYDIRDYLNIYKPYGSMEDFDELLHEVHKRGMRLIMDLVVNHTSDEHPWFIQSRSQRDNPYRDFYIWKDGKENGEPPNNWGSVFGGPAWAYDERTGQYYLHLFASKQPDLNWENPVLRKEIYKMMRFWLDKGVDGFRMDVINFISKDPSFPDGVRKQGAKYGDGSPYYMNGPRIHEFLQEMNREVLSHYDCMTVGEMPGATPDDAVRYTDPGNHEVNMVFTFEHVDLDGSEGDKWEVKELKLSVLKRVMSKWQTALHGSGWNSLYWNNHDQPRAVSRFGNDSGEYRVKSAKMLATCLHLMQGTPYIYQGEEIGMTNVRFKDIDSYRDIETLNMYKEKRESGWSHERIMAAIHSKSRDNARTPMQWDSSRQAGFTSGNPWISVNPRKNEINAEQAVADRDSIYHHYRKLIQLRKSLTVISEGDFSLLLPEDERIFAYRRNSAQDSLYVVCNFTEKRIELTDEELIKAREEGDLLLTNGMPSGKRILDPYEASVYYMR